MSLRRLGTNPDGTRQTVDDGPAYARRAGYGGSALGHFQATLAVVDRKPKSAASAEAAARHRRSL